MKKILSLVFILIILLAVTVPIYAQEATTDSQLYPITTAINARKCGLANGKDASERKCCALDFTTLIQNQQQGVVSVIPSSIQTIFVSLVNVIMPGISNIPVLKVISSPCYEGIPKGTGEACVCENSIKEVVSADIQKLCANNIAVAENAPDSLKKQAQDDLNACIKCATDQNGFYSGLGCIPGNLGDFITNFVLKIGIGIAGFISLMCIIYSSFLLQISRGQPEMVQKAREQITSCIIGLLMIIFSIFILRLIGVDILRIPGFS